MVLLCTCFSLYGQEKNPGGKVVAVQRPYYLPAPSSVVIYPDTTVRSAKDSGRSQQMLLPYTRQQGRSGFASFIQAPGKQGIETSRETITGKHKEEDWNIHGNILYNVDYRSYIDTPYVEKDIYYHTVQTYFDLTYKNILPVRVFLTSRFSNSVFTRRYNDVSLQYSAADYQNRIKQRIKSYQVPDVALDSLNYWQKLLDMKRLELGSLKGWARSTAVQQKLVEARERALYPGTPQPPGMPDTSLDLSLLRSQLAGRIALSGPDKDKVPSYLMGVFSYPEKDTAGLPKADTGFVKKYESEKKRIDSLQQQLSELEKKYNTLRERVAALKNRKNSGIDQAGSVQELERERKANQVPDSALPAGYKTLWAIKSIGVGRTMVSYSELSAKNVSINGFQLEYNPSYYVAVAAGTIDYRFRDLIVRNGTAPGQHLYLARVGTGQKNGNNIIATWYTGKKQLYNSSGTATVIQPDYRLMGFTIEGNYRLTPTTYVTAEVAKSSLPYYNQPGTNKNLLAAATRFNEHSNEAYSLKVQTLLNPTSTRITAFYKKYGANFQSFSLVTTGMEQQAWMVKADQPLFRKKLLLMASLKENDYSSPAANAAYQSNIVFKSVQATLRIPKWPVLSVGYFPSAQLVKLSDDSYTENTFYSLVANMNYYYKMNGVNMSSTAMYTRFFNKQADSAFIYSNTTNLLLDHSVFFNRLTWQSTASAAFSSDYNLYTASNEAQYALLQWLSIGAGLKYNLQTSYNLEQLGYNGNVIIKIRKLGEIQLMAEKGYIPGGNRQLVENNTGRFSFFRTF